MAYAFCRYVCARLSVIRDRIGESVTLVEAVDEYREHCWVFLEPYMSEPDFLDHCAMSWILLGFPDIPASQQYHIVGDIHVPNYKFIPYCGLDGPATAV